MTAATTPREGTTVPDASIPNLNSILANVSGKTTETLLRDACARVELDHDMASLINLKLVCTGIVGRFDARAARKAGKGAA
jgi:hypothetical protein